MKATSESQDWKVIQFDKQTQTLLCSDSHQKKKKNHGK